MTLAGALADLLRHANLPAIKRRVRRYTTPDLLIIDEIGYVPCDSDTADLLFRIVSTRHARSSSPRTSPTSSGATSSAMRRAPARWSNASRSTATSSTSTPTPGATKTDSRELDGLRRSDADRVAAQARPRGRLRRSRDRVTFLRVVVAAYILDMGRPPAPDFRRNPEAFPYFLRTTIRWPRDPQSSSFFPVV